MRVAHENATEDTGWSIVAQYALWFAPVAIVLALSALANAQEFNEESFEARMNRATQETLQKLDQRVTSLEQRVAGLEAQSKPPTAPASAAVVKIREEDLPWDAKPTPMAEVVRLVKLLNLKPHETLVDPGCGFDARSLIEAAKRYGCKGIGIEIDPARAESARQYVAEAGLSDRIQIITGDATKVDFKADAAFVYLESEVLEQLRPKLQRLSRVVSYQHPVYGMTMTQYGDGFVWVQAAPVVARASGTAVWQGKAYSRALCNSPTCAMCNSIRAQLAQAAPQRVVARSEVVTVQPAQSYTVQRTYTMNCTNGRCYKQYAPVRSWRGRW